MTLSIDVRTRMTGETVVVVRGDLGAATAPQLLAAVGQILRGRPARLCLDLGLITYADAGAVGALLQMQRDCAAVACHLVVEQVSPVLERALATAGVPSPVVPRLS